MAKPIGKAETLKPEQRLLLLDTWKRNGLPAGDFAALVGISKHTLYAWKKKFEAEGPAGLMDKPKGGPRGSHLPELTKRTILMLKEANPEWGCQRISDMLVRGPALPASASAMAKVLHEAGYVMDEVATKPHPQRETRFERAKPNSLWQTDLFTFILKRQNRRVYLVAFMDDHSRFIVGYGLHVSQSSALVIEVLRASLTAYGAPEEILTDNGSQYVTWRGKSAFSRELEKRGIKQIVAAPRRPQTLGTSKPRGSKPTPPHAPSANADLLRMRSGPAERRSARRSALFQSAVATRQQEVLDAHGRPLNALQDAAWQRATDRPILRQVLVELGYLYLTRR